MNIESLKNILPEKVFKEITMVIEKFQVNTPLRLSHFLAQCAHESLNFSATVESLNYSTDGLKKIFGKYFVTKNPADYARNPEKIGSLVYANRMGNGDEASKDGFKFRGRGYIQLTGKNNYTAFGNSINVDLTVMPELVASKYPLLSAAWFFQKNGINAISDKGDSVAVITEVTKKVNGGTIGLDDRINKFEMFYKALKP